jgi:hypothetical protein
MEQGCELPYRELLVLYVHVCVLLHHGTVRYVTLRCVRTVQLIAVFGAPLLCQYQAVLGQLLAVFSAVQICRYK